MVGRHLPDNKVHLGPSKNDVQSKGAYMAVLIGCVIRTATQRRVKAYKNLPTSVMESSSGSFKVTRLRCPSADRDREGT